MGLQDLIDQATNETDPRTQDWFLIPSVWPTVGIVVCYIVTIVGGMRVMKRREPFQLNEIMMAYNFSLVLLNAYIFYEFCVTSWFNFGFSKMCQRVERDTEMADRLARACWWFYFSKSIELCDTVFFMMRKKNNQISFLHLYHHSTMPLIWWVGVKYAPGGEAYFSASINSGIHVLMYTYYLLSAMGPHMQKYLWWKKYMTVMQLMQFWGILGHTAFAIYLDCFPNLWNWALIFYDFTHIALFSNFYYQTYTKKSRNAQDKKTSEKNGEPMTHLNGVVNGTHIVGNGIHPQKPARQRLRKD